MKLTLELDHLTAGTLEVARVARACSRTKEIILNTEAEIARTVLRLKTHLARFRLARRAQQKRLRRQQHELKRQLARIKSLKRPSRLKTTPARLHS